MRQNAFERVGHVCSINVATIAAVGDPNLRQKQFDALTLREVENNSV